MKTVKEKEPEVEVKPETQTIETADLMTLKAAAFDLSNRIQQEQEIYRRILARIGELEKVSG